MTKSRPLPGPVADWITWLASPYRCAAEWSDDKPLGCHYEKTGHLCVDVRDHLDGMHWCVCGAETPREEET